MKYIILAIALLAIFASPAYAAAPVANFTSNVTSGVVSLPVSFTDLSTNSPIGWAWYFGDEDLSGTWSQVNSSAGWSARVHHSSVVLSDGSIVLIGGQENGPIRKNDTWRSTDNGTTWTRINSSAGWSARDGFGSVVLSDNSIVIMGGYNGAGRENDTWRSTDNGTTWTEINASSGWSARSGHSSVVLPDDSIVLMGGNDDSYKNDTWRSTDNGATWTLMNSSSGWSPRDVHRSVVLSDGSIVLMGGFSVSDQVNDVWKSTDNGATWTEVNASAGWSKRHGFGLVALPDDSIVFMSGWSGAARENDVWRSMDSGATWTETNNPGWSARDSHSSVVLPNGSIVVMGGTDGSYKNDVWSLTTAGSNEQNPNHTYTAAGSYQVSLQAYNSDGYNRTIRTAYITAAVAPVANFTSNVTSGTVPLSVNFTDSSTNSPTSWFWDFGDGTNSTSQNPNHTYSSAGTYNVSLNATNVGGSNVSTQLSYITAADVPVANFTSNVTSGAVPLSVSFTDSSTNTPTSWFWDFGDGTNSTSQNPNHTYSSAGTYNVSLNATNIGGSNVSTQLSYITAADVPVANFTANVTYGATPLSVNFTDSSTNSPTSWFWDFGDGTNSTSQNPDHTYSSAGTYNVSLNATNVGGSNVSTQLSYITAYIAPVADFTADVTSGTAPLTVTFTDNSTNSPTSWLWDFGDGTNSTSQNPSHAYSSAGTYNVSLNASNVAGSNVSTQLSYITVTAASSGSSRSGGGDDDDERLVIRDPQDPDETGEEDTEDDSGDSTDGKDSEHTGSASLKTDADGKTLSDVTVWSSKETAYLSINAGTKATDASGRSVSSINIVDIPPTAVPATTDVPEMEGTIALLAYECTPDGTSFSPAIQLTFTLSEEEWALYGESARVGWYSDDTGEWEIIQGTADTDTRTITIQVSHFSTYALFGDDTGEPAGVTEEGGIQDGMSLSWLWILLLLAIVAGAVYYVTQVKKKE